MESDERGGLVVKGGESGEDVLPGFRYPPLHLGIIVFVIYNYHKVKLILLEDFQKLSFCRNSEATWNTAYWRLVS